MGQSYEDVPPSQEVNWYAALMRLRKRFRILVPEDQVDQADPAGITAILERNRGEINKEEIKVIDHNLGQIQRTVKALTNPDDPNPANMALSTPPNEDGLYYVYEEIEEDECRQGGTMRLMEYSSKNPTRPLASFSLLREYHLMKVDPRLLPEKVIEESIEALDDPAIQMNQIEGLIAVENPFACPITRAFIKDLIIRARDAFTLMANPMEA